MENKHLEAQAAEKRLHKKLSKGRDQFWHSCLIWAVLMVASCTVIMAGSVRALPAGGKALNPYKDYPLTGKASIKEDKVSGSHSAVLLRRVPYAMNQVYAVLTDYDQFPSYMPHTKKSQVTKQATSSSGVVTKWVDYTLVFLIWFKVDYSLKIDHSFSEADSKISWTMDQGEYFKDIQGYWHLKQLPSETSSGAPWTGITYVSKIEPKVSIPKAILDRITKKSVYELFEAVSKQLATTTKPKSSSSL